MGQMLEHVVPFCPAHMLYYCIYEVLNEQINDDDDVYTSPVRNLGLILVYTFNAQQANKLSIGFITVIQLFAHVIPLARQKATWVAIREGARFS